MPRLNVNVRLLLLALVVLLSGLVAAVPVEVVEEQQQQQQQLSASTEQSAAVTDTPMQQQEQQTLQQEQPLAGHESVDKELPGAPEGAQHTADAIVEPLTKLAHVTYDSVPVTHKPNDHMPLFHREGHDELSKS